jgi:hypothetical protein
MQVATNILEEINTFIFPPPTLKMEAAVYSETVTTCKNTGRHTPADHSKEK